MHQGRDRDDPAVPLAADQVLVGDVGALEEDLVELGLAGDLAQRANLHPVLLHVADEVGEALVLGRVGVGAGEQHAPLRLVRVGRPDLLPGDPPAAVLVHRLRLQRGEVGARLRLGEPLAPDLLRGEDRLEEALLLLLGAVGDDHRAAHHQAEHVGRRRRLRARHLLAEDRLLDQGRAASAVLLRPRDPRPAGLVHLALPVAAELELGLLAVGLRARDGCPRARREPRRGRPAPPRVSVRSMRLIADRPLGGQSNT